MEQLLLQIINEGAPAPYSDDANKRIAAYIMGEINFEKVKPILRTHKNHWFFYPEDPKTRKIAKDLADDRENLLPRLARFCRVIRHTGSERRLFSFFASSLKGVVTATEIYSIAGLGMDDLIADILTNLPEYWAPEPKSFGFKSYKLFFEEMYNQHPDAYERLTKHSEPAYALFASAYLHATDQKKYAKMADRIANIAGPILNKKAAEEAVEAAKNEACFAKSPHLKTLAKLSRKNAGSSAGAKADNLAMDLFYIAYANFDTHPEVLDLVNYLLIHTVRNLAFASLFKAQLVHSDITVEDSFPILIPKAKAGRIPMPQFLAYFGANVVASKLHLEDLHKLALTHETETLQATKMTDIRGGVTLLGAFWEKDKLPEKLAEYEKKVILTLGTKDEALLGYFLGKTPDLPTKVPNLDINEYNLAWTLATMTRYSQLPARLVVFSLSFGQWPGFFGNLIRNIREYYGDKYVSSFINSINAPDHEKIAALVHSLLYSYQDAEKKQLNKEITRLAKGNTVAYEKAFQGAAADVRANLLTLAYTQEPNYNPDWLVDCLGDTSKKVRDIAVAYLSPKTSMKPKIEELAKHKKKAIRESAEKLLMAYNATPAEAADETDFNPLAYVTANIPARAAKAIEWTNPEALPKVRLKDSEELADDKIIAGYIYLMVSQKEMALPRPAIMIRETLNKSDLAPLGLQLYHTWKADGAVAKHRTVLALAAIDGDDNFVRELTKDIQTWAESKRGALAAEATRAMALQGGSLALMTVDSYSKKFKNKQVKRVAEEAFLFAATQLGVDPEVLGDRIVPTLGFDERGQQIVDYGNRQFTVTITPDLQISIKNDKDKIVKTLPAIGVNDDKETATAAKAAFSAMKKNLKAVVALQNLRLEQALSSNRTWARDAWNKLFVENPIMNMFAIGLVWGTYDNTGTLTTSFRYMEDGSFVTVDEDELELPDDAHIGLCHPLDLGEEAVTQWKQQLEDYEITQSVDQLSRKVFTPPADDKATQVKDFGGAVMYGISLLGKLQKLGWYKGSVVDAGGYFNFYKEDSRLGLGVLLDFSGSYIGADNSEEVTIYDAVFYKAGTIDYGSYVYDEVKEDDRIPLKDVPRRFYSEACYDIDRATATRIDTVENWVKNR